MARTMKLFLIAADVVGPNGEQGESLQHIGDYPDWESLQVGLQAYYAANGGPDAVMTRTKGIRIRWPVIYSFVGGSHDGTTGDMGQVFEPGFAIAIQMRGGTSGNREVYRLEDDGKFHYQNYIKKPGDP